MRHNVYGAKLGRNKNERTSLFRGLVRSLVLHQSIQTTEVKAKAIKGLVDRSISQAKKSTPGSLMSLQRALGSKEVLEKLIREVAPRYKTRTSGFTTVVRLGRRQGDGAMMVKLSLVEENKQLVRNSAKSEEQDKSLTESKKSSSKKEAK